MMSQISLDLHGGGNKLNNTQPLNYLEFQQYVYHAIIINRRQSVSGIMNNLICVTVLWKIKIQTDIYS